MDKPLVTVIVPAYNHESYIVECLESVVSQTYDNIQIIVINDGSRDNTGLLISEFVSKQERKVEYISKDNEGLCKTLNLGLSLSKGEYISLIASDDVWCSNKLEEQVTFLENNKNIGLVYSDAYFLRGTTKTSMKYSEYKPRIKKHYKNSIQNRNMYESLLIENLIIAGTVLLRSECFETMGLFDEKLKYEDYDMWLRVSIEYPIAYIDKPLAYYRTHDNNVSNNTSLMLIGALQAIYKQFRQGPLKKKPCKFIILLLMFMFVSIKNRMFKYIKIKSS